MELWINDESKKVGELGWRKCGALGVIRRGKEQASFMARGGWTEY